MYEDENDIQDETRRDDANGRERPLDPDRYLDHVLGTGPVNAPPARTGRTPGKGLGRGLGIAGALTALALVAGAGGAYLSHLDAASSTGSGAPTPQVLAQTTGAHVKTAGSTGKVLTVAQVANRVEPAIVDISVNLVGGEGSAAGTGMIITPNGEVLTNNHVIADAATISVKIPGHGTHPAYYLGYDRTKDMALIKIEGVTGLPTVTFSKVPAYIGEPVVAIGNALDLPGKPTVTSGTVTATGRSITAVDETLGSEHLTDMLQTDAPLEPGDSGGPLLNRMGQVVGMDTAAYSGSSVTTQSTATSDVGFSIPIANALAIVRDIQQGKAVSGLQIGPYPMLGVEVVALSDINQNFQQLPVASGVFVEGVIPGTGAARTGLQEYDIITAINGVKVTSPTVLEAQIRKYAIGATVRLTWVSMYGGSTTASVKLGKGFPQ